MFEKRYYSDLSELGEIKEGDLVTLIDGRRVEVSAGRALKDAGCADIVIPFAGCEIDEPENFTMFEEKDIAKIERDGSVIGLSYKNGEDTVIHTPFVTVKDIVCAVEDALVDSKKWTQVIKEFHVMDPELRLDNNNIHVEAKTGYSKDGNIYTDIILIDEYSKKKTEENWFDRSVEEGGGYQIITCLAKGTDDDTYRSMAEFGTDFFLEFNNWIKEHEEILDRTGYKVIGYNDNDDWIWSYRLNCSSIQEAKMSVNISTDINNLHIDIIDLSQLKVVHRFN